MRHRTTFILSLIALAFTTSAVAQRWGGTPDNPKVEIAPMVGFESGSSVPTQIQLDQNGNPTSTIDNIGVAKGLSYGAFVDLSKWQNFAFEFMFMRNPTHYTNHDAASDLTFTTYHADIDQYQFGGIFHLAPADAKLRPYFGAGIGFAHDSNSTNFNSNGNTSFAFNFGGGVKYYPTKHFGFRADARYMPSYADTISGLVCDQFYGCYTGSQKKYFNRFNTTAGITFKF